MSPLSEKDQIKNIIVHMREKYGSTILNELLDGCDNILRSEVDDAIINLRAFLKSEAASVTTMRIFFKIISSIDKTDAVSEVLRCLHSDIIDVMVTPANINEIPQLLDDLRFNKSSANNHIVSVGQNLVSQLINRAYDEDEINLALYLENRYYSDFITRIETEDAFGNGMGAINETASKAGERVLKKIHSVPNSVSNKKIVGFFVHSASMLAHIRNIFNFLKSCKDIDELNFKPIIFCFGGRSEDFANSFNSINVKVEYLDQNERGQPIDNFLDRLIYLKSLCSNNQVSHFVWVCLAVWMPFTFSLRLAETQIWWSQKWRNLTNSQIDKYIFSFGVSERENFNEVCWRNGWFQIEKWVENPRPEAAKDVKKLFNGKTILGSLAREDKMTDPRFLSTIATILKKNHNAVYLWTGRHQYSEINDFFQKENILHQTYFLGWVDLDVYSNVLDIFLDTFPIGCGHTALQAMEMGTPIVIHKSNNEFRTLDLLLSSFKATHDNNEVMQDKFIEIFNSANDQRYPLYTCVEDTDQYIQTANKMIEDAEFRRRVGNAWKSFVTNFMCNPRRSAEVFAKCIFD